MYLKLTVCRLELSDLNKLLLQVYTAYNPRQLSDKAQTKERNV